MRSTPDFDIVKEMIEGLKDFMMRDIKKIEESLEKLSTKFDRLECEFKDLKSSIHFENEKTLRAWLKRNWAWIIVFVPLILFSLKQCATYLVSLDPHDKSHPVVKMLEKD